jgi:hypothetical protein
LNDPKKLAMVTRIKVTAKVPPTTNISEGALTNNTKGPPRLIAVAMMTYASINPTIDAMSTQLLLLNHCTIELTEFSA